MNRIVTLIISCILGICANAETVQIDGIYYNLIGKGSIAEVTSNPNKYSGDIVIPAYVDCGGSRYSVTSICESAFSMCQGLKTVSIPGSVTFIGESAFQDCSSLSSIDIPNGVLSVKSGVFLRCSGLTSVTIPSSVTSIGSYAFYGCSGLTSVTIPSSVTSIGSDAFYGCSGLISVTIPSSVTSMGGYAFQNCSGLTSVSIPNSLTTIYDYTFAGCAGLKSIMIPSGVTTIGSYAFENCVGLTSLDIPNSVVSIGSYAFSGCSGLTSIVIGSGVLHIFKRAFSFCENLSDVYCKAKGVPETEGSVFEKSYIEYSTLHVPDSLVDSYKGAIPWCEFKNVMTLEGNYTCNLSITSTGGGYVSYSDNTFTETTKTYIVNGGASAKLTFIPNNGYKIGSVKVNGIDVTTSISNNAYTINAIDSDTSVEVIFEVDVPSIDIEKYITAYNTGGSFMQTNDLLNSGSQLNWAFKNNSSVSVTLKNMQLIDGKTGSEGNIMSVNQLVESESSVAYSVTIGASGIHIPVICRFRYDYNGKEYVVDAVYKDTYSLTIEASGKGAAKYNGTTVRDKTSEFEVRKGSSVTISFTPDSGQRVKSLKVNNVDVTSKLSNDQYTIGYFSNNTNVSVTFETIPTYTLGVTSTGNGYVTYSGTTINGSTKSFTVAEGASATMTFTPNTGYKIESVKVNGSDVTSSVVDNKYTISNIDGNTNVSVTFKVITYSLDITSTGGGYVTCANTTVNGTTKSFTYDYGASAVLTFTPNSGYKIKSVKVSNVDVTSNVNNNQYTIENISENTTVSVTFEAIPPTTYQLSITSSAGGNVTFSDYTISGATSNFSVNAGASTTLTITPSEDYEIESVKVNGLDVTSDVTNGQYIIRDINQNTEVTVTFKSTPKSTVIVTSLSGGYTLFMDVNINNSTQTFSLDEGATAVLSFFPNSGYRLSSVKIDGVEAISNITDNRYILSNLKGLVMVSVSFEAIPVTPTYTMSVSSSDGGSVKFQGNTIESDTWTGSVNEGTAFMLEFVPKTGYRLKNVTVNGADVTNWVLDGKYTISEVSENTVVDVLFELIPTPTYSLTIAASGAGAVTYLDYSISGTEGSYDIVEGTSVVLTFTPDKGYRIKSVLINYKDVTKDIVDGRYQISNISQNTIVEVVFERITYSLKITASGKGVVTYSDNTIGGGTTKNFNIDEGTSLLLTLTPNSGYRIGRVEVNGEDVTSMVSGDHYYIENVSQNTTVDVTFDVIPTRTLIITSSGIGYVLYSSSTVNGETKSFSVDEGSSVTLEFKTVSGYHVGSLLVNGVDVASYIVDNQYTIDNYSQTTTVRVIFEEIPPVTYTLSITSSGSGSVNYSGFSISDDTKSFSVNEGTSAMLNVQPNDGYQVKSLKVNGADITPYISNNQYTINDIHLNITVSVEFEAIPPTTYTLSITSSGDGSVIYNGNTISVTTQSFTVTEGESVTLNFTPDARCQVGSLKVDGVDVTSDISVNQYTINNISGNTEVVATFEEKVIPDGSVVAYEGVNYRVVSGKEKTVNVTIGEYAHSLDIPATIVSDDVTLSVSGMDEDVLMDNPQLAAVIWNPAVKFDAKVSNPNFLLYVTLADYAPSGIKNVIVNGTAENITLTEASGGNDFYCPKAFTARNISYTHNYSMITGVGECRGWETIALPFNVQKIVHSEKGQLVPFAAWYSGEMRLPFWLYELTENGWKEAEAIKAYAPYIISMPNNELYYESSRLNGRVTFSAENVAVEATNSKTVSYNGKTFVPNFADRTSSGLVYALNVKSDWATYNGSLAEGSHFVQNLRTVHPFEAYMTTENNARAAISIFDDDATEVQGVKILLDQRKIKGVYNLNGQKLDGDNDRKLPAGIYIIDGQKVMAK